MKVCVCDICRMSEKDATGGLFNLKDAQIDVDICGECAANVLAALLTDLPTEVTAFIKKLARVPVASLGRTERPTKVVAPIDKDLEKFIAESSKAMHNGQVADKERVDQLTKKIGEQVFIEQFGQPQKIGSAVKLGMPGRKAARRVEIVEEVPGKPDCYFVFQLKE